MDNNNVFSVRKKINKIIDKLSGQNISIEDAEKLVEDLGEFETKHISDILLKRMLNSDEEFFVATFIIKQLALIEIVPDILNIIFEKSFPDEKKAVLISILDEIGAEIDHIDFNPAFEDVDKMGKKAIDNLLDEIDSDFLSIERAVDWLYEVPQDIRFSFIDSVCKSENKKAFSFLQKFLTIDDKELVIHIINNLSKMNASEALTTIKEALPYISDEEIISAAERALRKLSFKGVTEEDVEKKPHKFGQIYKILVTNIDGVGSQSLWIARYDKKKLDCMFILMNEKKGIKDCFGNKMTKKQFNNMIEQQTGQNIITYEITYEKALKLIKDALFINKANNERVASAFHFLRRNILEETIIKPEQYVPYFKEKYLKTIENNRDILQLTEMILDIVPECGSWFVVNNYIYDIADELLLKTKHKQPVEPTKKFLKKVVKNAVMSEIPYLKRRLLLTADLLESVIEDGEEIRYYIDILLSAAINLEKDTENNLFLLAMAEQSIFQAELSLLHGADYRKSPELFS